MARRDQAAVAEAPADEIEEIGLGDGSTNSAGDEPVPVKAAKRVLTPEEQEVIFNAFRAGASLTGAAKEAGITWEFLTRWLFRGGFQYSDARVAQAARVLPPEEPYYTFARTAEAAWEAGQEVRQAKSPAATPGAGRKAPEYDVAAATQVLSLVAQGATLNRAATMAGVKITAILGWLRAGAYPSLVLGGKRVLPENAQEPYRQFAVDFKAAEDAAVAAAVSDEADDEGEEEGGEE